VDNEDNNEEALEQHKSKITFQADESLRFIVKDKDETSDLDDDAFLDQFLSDMKKIQDGKDSFQDIYSGAFTKVERIYKKNPQRSELVLNPFQRLKARLLAEVGMIPTGLRAITCIDHKVKQCMRSKFKVIRDDSNWKVFEDLTFHQRQHKRIIYSKWREALEFRRITNRTREELPIKFEPWKSRLVINNREFLDVTKSMADFLSQQGFDLEYHRVELENGPVHET
jgi:hypothetical protein